jgi:hypothetical protein
MKIKFDYRPNKIPFKVKNDFDMIILLTKNTKWPKINRFLLSLGFLWSKDTVLDQFNKPLFIMFSHKIYNAVIITSVN